VAPEDRKNKEVTKSVLHPDFIIIGAGITGVRAVIELASHGQVVVLTKSKLQDSNTEFAQGGIAVAMSGDDEVGLHYDDTIRAGNGLCDEKTVRTLVEEGPARIQELIDWGTLFLIRRVGSWPLAGKLPTLEIAFYTRVGTPRVERFTAP